MVFKGKPIRTEKRGECHVVTSHKFTTWQGYPIITVKGKELKMHRYVWEQHNRPLKQGEVVMHLCDNRECINLEHLRVGTQLDNIRDRDAKGRQATGARNGRSHAYKSQRKVV